MPTLKVREMSILKKLKKSSKEEKLTIGPSLRARNRVSTQVVCKQSLLTSI